MQSHYCVECASYCPITDERTSSVNWDTVQDFQGIVMTLIFPARPRLGEVYMGSSFDVQRVEGKMPSSDVKT